MPHLVLIEDEPGITDFVVRGLTLAGHRVESALDGQAGLELALGDEVDLVVLDLMLPRMSGTDVLQRLADQRPGLPVIVVTARGELEDRVGGLKAGAVDYLVKPFAMDELEARIDAQLPVHAGAEQPPSSGRRADADLITGAAGLAMAAVTEFGATDLRVAHLLPSQHRPSAEPRADPARSVGV